MRRLGGVRGAESPRVFAFVAGALGAWQLLIPSVAEARTELTVDTSVETEVSSNPYLLFGNDLSVASVAVAIAPTLVSREASGTTKLSGRVEHREFTGNYSSTQSVMVEALADRRLSSRFTMNASARFDTSIVGSNDFFSPLPLPGGVLTPPYGPGNLLPIIDDLTLLGTRLRRHSISAGAGVAFQASARDQLSLSYSGNMTRYPSGNAAQEFNYISQSFGYNRVLDSRTSVGANINVSRSDYLRTALGDGTVISPQATVTTKINGQWTLNASLGASFSSVRDFTGTVKSTSLSGSASFCRAGERSNFCLSAQRFTSPASFGGLRTQSSASASYRYRFSPTDDASADVSYSRASEGQQVGARPIESLRTQIAYNKRLGGNWRAFVSLGTFQVFDSVLSRRSNSEASIGLRYLFSGRQ